MAFQDPLMMAEVKTEVKTEVNEAEVKTEVNEAEVKSEVNEAEEDGRTLEQTEVKREVKIEIDVAEEDWRTLDQSGQGSTHDWSENNTADTHHETDTQTLIAVNTKHELVTESDTFQWIKTEPVEENETSDVFHQFQSEPVDKSERKGDIKHEFLTGVDLSCGQMSTGSFEQAWVISSKVKLEPCTDFESNSYKYTETLVDIKREDDFKTEPEEAVTSSDVNMERPDIYSCDQTKVMTDIKVTVTGDAVTSESISVTTMDEVEDKSSGDEQECNEPCLTVHQDPGSNKSATSVTTTPRPFVCDVCQKGFTTKHHLKRHKLIHSDIRQFVCDVCHKSFKQSQNLAQHKLTHSDIKKFVCDMCDKSFIYSSYLTQHKLIHSDIKQFVCDVCDKCFKQSSHLTQHKLIHSDIKQFVCDVCDKSFKQTSHLTRHKLTHTDIKQFVCDVCDKSFKRRSHLTRHKLTHTDIKQYICDVCHKSFKQSRYFTQHKLIHNDIK